MQSIFTNLNWPILAEMRLRLYLTKASKLTGIAKLFTEVYYQEMIISIHFQELCTKWSNLRLTTLANLAI